MIATAGAALAAALVRQRDFVADPVPAGRQPAAAPADGEILLPPRSR